MNAMNHSHQKKLKNSEFPEVVFSYLTRISNEKPQKRWHLCMYQNGNHSQKKGRHFKAILQAEVETFVCASVIYRTKRKTHQHLYKKKYSFSCRIPKGTQQVKPTTQKKKQMTHAMLKHASQVATTARSLNFYSQPRYTAAM